MTRANRKFPRHSSNIKAVLGWGIICLSAFALPAMADEATAKLAIGRADAKVEIVTRQAGQAGNMGDQSFNMARQRLTAARAALKSSNYDNAERLAEQSALLASLTSERATLAALRTSNNNLLASAMAAPAQ
jgi:hypothetical protein